MVINIQKGFIQLNANGSFSYYTEQDETVGNTLENILSNKSGISESGFVYLTLSGKGTYK